jgi:transposase
MYTSSRSRELATTLLPPGSGLRLEHISTGDQTIELMLVTTTATAPCPLCATPATRIHSRYTRTLADLPWGGFAVRLYLEVRKFFCPTVACPRRIFAERLPAVVAPYARRTSRLGDVIRVLGFALGGEAGSRLADRLRMAASPSTLLRLIRRTPDEPVPTPRVLAVDDFARRKSQTYGTILVDLEQHRPIDLLPDRTADTLAAWLRAHPGVEVISRDRSTEYMRGATVGAPDAIQVADRFHLLTNLREALERLLERNRARFRGIVLPARATNGELSIPPTAQRKPVRRSPTEEAVRQARRAYRQTRYAQIQTLRTHGVSIRSIAQRLQISRGTVYRYLRLDAQSVATRTHHVPSMLDPHLPYLYHRWQAGCHNGMQLWRELCARGYPGSRKMVAIWVRHQRKTPALTTPRKYLPCEEHATAVHGTAADCQSMADRVPASRQLVWFLLRDPRTLTLPEQATLRQLQQVCPAVATASPLVHEFLRLVRQRQLAAFDAWRALVAKSNVPELQSFVAGLDRDDAAVRAALSMAWSNGQTEGQVNRLKTLKRQMYGRANFDLLRKRVLHAT